MRLPTRQFGNVIYVNFWAHTVGPPLTPDDNPLPAGVGRSPEVTEIAHLTCGSCSDRALPRREI
jgi:hypothetical protein